eukprot:1433563-Rhodomonas_salina.1
MREAVTRLQAACVWSASEFCLHHAAASPHPKLTSPRRESVEIRCCVRFGPETPLTESQVTGTRSQTHAQSHRSRT